MRYSFQCRSKRHQDESSRSFEQFIHIADGKRVDQIQCPECGGLAKRDFVTDFKTVAITGATPIQVNGSKHGIYSEVKFAAGRFKKNPDGSVDTNHAPFKDTRELDQWANGKNDLGPPKLDDSGKVMRRQDGSMIRTGAKLVKFSNNRRPPVNKQRVEVPDAWVDSPDTGPYGGAGAKPISLRDAGVGAARYRSPQRGR